MSKIISQLEFWLILFGLATAPNWSWSLFGGGDESRMIVIGLAVAGLALLELVNAVAHNFSVIPNPAQRGEESPLTDKPRSLVVPMDIGTPRDDNRGFGFGFFKNPLNWIISAPLLLGLISWLRPVILNSFQDLNLSQFFGFGAPWSQAVLPILLLTLWHFLLRSFFTRPRSEASTPRSLLSPEAPPFAKGGAKGDGEGGLEDARNPLLKFAFVWLIVFAFVGLTRGLLHSSPNPLLSEERDIANIGLWFALASALALVLAALRVPLSAPEPPLSPPLGKGGRGVRLGRFIYLLIIILMIILAFFIRLEINFARAARAASKGDFAGARRLNPYHPEYGLSWVEREIDNLGNTDLTSDITASKQKVGEIIKALDGLSSLPGDSLRAARAFVRLGRFVQGAGDKAEPHYLAAIASAPANQDLLLEASRFYRLEKKDPLQALRLLDSRPMAAPAALAVEKALVLEAAGREEEALSFLRSRENNPYVLSGPEIRYHIGRLAYNLGKYDEARDIFLAILKDDPDYSDANYSLGIYWERVKNYQKARSAFNKALELNPGNEVVKKKIDAILNKR